MATQQLGRYEVLRELGRGAMGRVYLARDPAIDRLVAIKTISFHSNLSPLERDERRQRFRREAQAAGKLLHPGIVLVFDVGEQSDGDLFIAMEYLEGVTLEAFTRPPDLLPVQRALDLAIQACDALDFAHRRKIVHRDIKPANLMVVAADRLKITDFGLAKDPGTDLTQDGTLVGTPSYMAPEQIMGRPLDGRSDLFSLAVVLYELLTGVKPFQGDTISTVIYRILHEPPPPPRGFNERIPPAVGALLSRALQKEPAERFQRGAELAEGLRQAMRASAVRRVDTTRVSGAPAATPPAGVRRRGRRVRGTLAAVASVLALGLIGVAIFAPNGRHLRQRLGARFAAVAPAWSRLRTLQSRAVVPADGPADAASGPAVRLVGDGPGVRFQSDGQPIPGGRLPLGEGTEGRRIVATDGCREGEIVLGSLSPGAQVPVPLTRAATERISVHSDPEGALVHVDGEAAAEPSPLRLDLARCHDHILTATLPGRREARLQLAAGGDWQAATAAPLRLEPLPDGTLLVESPYRVDVLEAGSQLGTSGERIHLAPGPHRIRLRNAAHRVEVDASVDIASEAESRLRPDLPPLGDVRVNAYPGNAAILVDGVDAGAPPVALALGRGEHTFVCRWGVGAPRESHRRVVVAVGTNAPVNFRQGS